MAPSVATTPVEADDDDDEEMSLGAVPTMALNQAAAHPVEEEEGISDATAGWVPKMISSTWKNSDGVR